MRSLIKSNNYQLIKDSFKFSIARGNQFIIIFPHETIVYISTTSNFLKV